MTTMDLSERYPPKSPHYALATWLDAWATQDWDRLVMATQPSWRLTREHHRDMLVRAYEHLILDHWSVPMTRRTPVTRIDNLLAPGQPAVPQFIVFADIRCRVEFTMLNAERHHVKDVATVIVSRLVRECVDGSPAERDNPKGSWWVDPRSMTRGDKLRTRVLPLQIVSP